MVCIEGPWQEPADFKWAMAVQHSPTSFRTGAVGYQRQKRYYFHPLVYTAVEHKATSFPYYSL